MEAEIFARGDIKLTNKLRDHVDRKTERLDRYLPDMLDLRVDLTEQKARNSSERQIAQITLQDKSGTILRAEESSSDIYAAVDSVVDKMYRQIKRYRDKRQRKNRRETIRDVALEPLPVDTADDDLGNEPMIVRRKSFAMQPMSPEEAIDQMELLGHDFYMFFNPDEKLVNLVYRRKDKSFGLLQPEMA